MLDDGDTAYGLEPREETLDKVSTTYAEAPTSANTSVGKSVDKSAGRPLMPRHPARSPSERCPPGPGKELIKGTF